MFLRLTEDQETMVIENVGLVRWVIKNYKTYIDKNKGNLDYDDIIQEGICGLMKAVEYFDPSKGKLSTYAFKWIFRSIQLALHYQPHLIRLPREVQEKLVKFSQQGFYDRKEMLKGFSEESGINLAVLLAPESLARPLRRSGDPLEDILPDETESGLENLVIEKRHEEMIIEALTLILDEREVQIVLMRSGIGGYEPHDMTQIGKKLAKPLSKQSVDQILKKIKIKLTQSPVFIARLSIPPTSSG